MASFFLFLLLLLFFFLTNSRTNFGQQISANPLAGEGLGNKAGVRARLSQKGVNYIFTFLKDILIQQVAGPSPLNNNEEIQIQTQLEGGKAKLQDLHLDIQKGPTHLRTRTEAPKHALVEMPAINFVCKGKMDSGELFQMGIVDSTLLLNLSASKHAQGAPNFRIEKCQLRLEKSPIISVEGANDESRKAALEKGLTDAGAEMLEQLICSRVVFILEERINQRFSLLPSKLSLAQLNGTFIVDELMRRVGVRRQRRAEGGSGTDSDGNANSELFASFNLSRADSLFLDYSIIDIRADQMGIEVDSSGEVSIRGRGGTPFGPIALSLPSQPNEEQMLQLLVADFMPNSLLYHGHSIGLFNARIDPSTPHFGPIMRTTCPPVSGLLFCLGDFFPTLRSIHPNHGLALLFSTVHPPTIKFRTQSAGGISFSLFGKIVMSLLGGQAGSRVTKNETEVAQMEISVDAHMKIRLSNTMVKPKVNLDKIVLKTLTPEVLAQSELDKSVLLAREVLQRMVNDMLRGGIPIPVHPLLMLNRPKVKIMDRHLLLLTNVEFNEPLMRQITSASLDGRTVL